MLDEEEEELTLNSLPKEMEWDIDSLDQSEGIKDQLKRLA